MTLTLITAFGFPVITAVGYTLLLLIYRARFGAKQASVRLDAHGFYLYPMFLSLPLAAAVAEPASRRLISHQFTLVDSSAALTALVVLVAGVVGLGQFLLESRAGIREPRGGGDPSARMIDGRTDNWRAFNPRPATYIVLAAVVVLAEEVIWRGVLINGLIERSGWPEVAALAVTSVAFGFNHYYFGLRNIVLKTVFGAILGLLLLITHSLAAPIAAHLVFEVVVGVQLLGHRPLVAEATHAAP